MDNGKYIRKGYMILVWNMFGIRVTMGQPNGKCPGDNGKFGQELQKIPDMIL